MKKFSPLILLGLFFAMALPALATPFSLGLNVGSLGWGFDAGYRFNDMFKLRGNINFFPTSFVENALERSLEPASKASGVADELDTAVEFRNFTAGLLLDVHPFMGKFRVSAGLYYADLGLKLTGQSRNPYRKVSFGDADFDVGDMGRLEGEVSFNKLAPYLGIGWGTGAGKGTNFFFDLNIGAMYFSNPKAEVRTTGNISRGSITLPTGLPFYPSGMSAGDIVSVNDPNLPQPVRDMYSEYQRELNDTNDSLRKVRNYLHWYPVFSLGFTFRF